MIVTVDGFEPSNQALVPCGEQPKKSSPGWELGVIMEISSPVSARTLRLSRPAQAIANEQGLARTGGWGVASHGQPNLCLCRRRALAGEHVVADGR